MAYTHALFALALIIMPTVYLSGAPVGPFIIIIVIAASLLPDIDHPSSMMGRAIKPVSLIIHETVGHRSLTHSIAAIAGFTIVVSTIVFKYDLKIIYIYACVLGYSSHILADMLNPTGVELLYPNKKRYSILHKRGIRVGSPGETILSLLLLGGIIFSVFIQSPVRAFI